MASGDFFKRKRLLPSGKASEEPDEASEESEHAEPPGEEVFDRPTITPDVSPEVHAARTMRELETQERAVTAPSPARKTVAAEPNTKELERIEPELDQIELGLSSQPPDSDRATTPGDVPGEILAQSSQDAISKELILAALELDQEEDAESALGFVDAHARNAKVTTAPDASGQSQNQDKDAASLSGLYAVGDFSGALALAEERQKQDPKDEVAGRYISNCTEVLGKMYCARIGPLQQTVRVDVAPDKIRWLSIDHRAGFLLSLVDGQSSVEDLLDICGMRRLDALRIIAELVSQKIVSLSS